MKSRVRGCDERNLEAGSHHDVNWMLRELGLDEIVFEPPPLRAPAAEDRFDEDETEDDALISRVDFALPPAPLLPAEPPGIHEAGERLRVAMETFETAESAIAEMEAAGSTLIEDVDEITAGLIGDGAFPLLIPFLVQAWFAFVPPGTRGPQLDFERLSKGIRGQMEGIVKTLSDRSPAGFSQFMQSSPQPNLTMTLIGMLVESTSGVAKKACPTPEEQAAMACVLKAVVAELDHTCRSVLNP
jgi:hypothetical protein